MSDLLQKVQRNIASRELLKSGQRVVIAVSGGLDSMVLLDILCRLATEEKWKITVAHLNHGLRGRSSDADGRLVRKTARAKGLPIVVGKADVRAMSRAKKISIEMAARKLRHEFLARVAGRHGIRTIALAHHADDQVELFFLRLMRGAGSEGISGMQWQNSSPVDSKIQLIRPLLDVPKTMLAHYARQRRVSFREDATNQSLDIQRNRVRHELLPLIRKKYQPAIVTTVARLAEIVSAEADCVMEWADQWLEAGRGRRGDEAETGRHAQDSTASPAVAQKLWRGGPGRLQIAFARLPVAVQRYVLHLQLLQQGVSPNFELIEKLREEPNRAISLPSLETDSSDVPSVSRNARGLVQVAPLVRLGFSNKAKTISLKSAKAGEIRFGGARIQWSRVIRRDSKLPRFKAGREFFDADKVGESIVLRHWQPGDRFQPIGMANSVKVQDVLVNQKVPKALRHKLIVATTSSGEVFWVETLRISERFKLSTGTKRCLQWRWQSA